MSTISERRGQEPDRKALARFARYLLSSRRNRDRLLDDIEFGEPAWDLLLDLYISHVEGTCLCVSSLGVGAGMPATTAIRWIGTLEHLGYFERRRDPHDGRRVFVRIAPKSVAAMETCLIEMRTEALRAIG